jgi:drug/metabolite transporter (DMT)-like permease
LVVWLFVLCSLFFSSLFFGCLFSVLCSLVLCSLVLCSLFSCIGRFCAVTWRQLAMLFVLSAIWGASFLLIKICVATIAPMTLVAARLVLAAALLVVVMRMQGMHLPRTGQPWRGFAVLAVVGLILPFWLITWGEQWISSGLAATVLATNPLMSVLLTTLVLGDERLGLPRMLGLLLGFAGVVVAVGAGLDNNQALLGYLAVFGAAFCYAISAIYAKRAYAGMPPLVLSTGQMVVASGLALPLAVGLDGVPQAWPPAVALWSLAALAFVCTAAAYILFYWLLAEVGATRTSLLTYLVPGFALIYGALLLGEPFTLRIACGLVLVVLGILIVSGRLGLGALRLGSRRPA